MLLSGKALEEFDNWYLKTYHSTVKRPIGMAFHLLAFKHKNDVCKNALIIEWFDSVGIYISALPYGNKGTFFSKVMTTSKNGIPKEYMDLDVNQIGIEFSSRQVATEQAITKANEIYNERHGKANRS